MNSQPPEEFKIDPLELLEHFHTKSAHLFTICGILVQNKLISDDLYQKLYEEVRNKSHPLNEILKYRIPGLDEESPKTD